MATVSLLEEHEWLGEFWQPGNEGSPVPGVLRYSPQAGLLLQTVQKGRQPTTDDDYSRTLHGFVETKGPVTLLGALPRSGGLFSGWGLERDYLVSTVVVRDHIDVAPSFSAITFEANNVPEFFRRRAFALDEEYTKSPVLEGDPVTPEVPATDSMPGLRVSVEQHYLASFVPNDPASAFLLEKDDDAALIEDLNQAIRSVLQDHKKASLLKKEEIGYQVTIESADQSPIPFGELRQAVFQLCNLFSLFFLKPVIPTKVWVRGEYDTSLGRHLKHEVLFATLYNERQLRSARKDQDRPWLPVTSDDIRDNYNGVLRSWFEFVRRDLNLVYTCVTRHPLGDLEPYQEYVLLIAALEQCYVLQGSPRNTKRYDWFIENYVPPPIKDHFLKYLPDNTDRDEIGAALGDVRNCIVHPTKVREAAFKKYRSSLESSAIRNLCELLFLSLVEYVYRLLGLPSATIDRFQREAVERHLIIHGAGG